jgi:PAS domain S-box-containing protein
VREVALDLEGPGRLGIPILLNANFDKDNNQLHFAVFPARERREHERQMLKTQTELTQSRDYLQLAEKLAHVGHWRVDIATGDAYWSPEIFHICGHDPATHVPRYRDGAVVYHEQDRDRVYSTISQAMETGEGFTIHARLLRHNTGELRHVEASGVCQKDQRGKVTGLFGVFQDITDMVRAQEEMALSEARYRLLADNASDVITVVDITGRIEYISPSVLALLGYLPEHFIGRQVSDFIVAEDYPEVEAAYRQYITCGDWANGPHIRYRILHYNGHPVWLEAHPSIILDETGQPVRYQDVVRDVTVQKEIEEALAQASIEANAAAEAKAQFLATMSHELRTPLTSIIGYSSLLRDLLDEADSNRRHAQRIHGAGQGLLALINDILDHSKLEAGHLELDIAPCSVRELAHDVIDLLAVQAEGKGLALRLTGAEALEEDLMLDEQRLRQVLMNLINNAVKFTSEGSVTVHMEIEESWLHVAVSDTGPGIARSSQQVLFQRFSQVHTTPSAGGTGLGLLICKQLIELMGGRIDVESDLGSGATFWFEIPISRFKETGA